MSDKHEDKKKSDKASEKKSGHGGHHDDHDDHHDGKYTAVGAILMVGTVITVAASWVHFQSLALTIFIALLIASIKASFVAGVFMHLVGEKKAIIHSLLLTAFFFVVLIFVPVLTASDSEGEMIGVEDIRIRDESHTHGHGHGHGDDHGHGDAGHGEHAADDGHGHDHAHGEDDHGHDH